MNPTTRPPSPRAPIRITLLEQRSFPIGESSGGVIDFSQLRMIARKVDDYLRDVWGCSVSRVWVLEKGIRAYYVVTLSNPAMEWTFRGSCSARRLTLRLLEREAKKSVEEAAKTGILT